MIAQELNSVRLVELEKTASAAGGGSVAPGQQQMMTGSPVGSPMSTAAGNAQTVSPIHAFGGPAGIAKE